MADMCWRKGQDSLFHAADGVMDKFCNRKDINKDQIAFGHPAMAKCGECVEIRVKRRDGQYNYVTVMTTDHPENTNTSPELSDEAKQWLDRGTANGEACPRGGGPRSKDCQMSDRLDFEHRVVPCAR